MCGRPLQRNESKFEDGELTTAKQTEVTARMESTKQYGVNVLGGEVCQHADLRASTPSRERTTVSRIRDVGRK